jgi:hypothetical protein
MIGDDPQSEIHRAGADVITLTNFKITWRQLMLLFLGVAACSVFCAVRLMINPPYMAQAFMFQCTDYGRIELGYAPALTVCRAIRNCAPSAPRWLLQAVLGRPFSKETAQLLPGCPAMSANVDETWIYDVGPGILLMLCCNGDNCTAVRFFKKQYDYEQWKMRQIEKISVGLTESEIATALGPNYDRRHFPSCTYFAGTDFHKTAPSDGWVYFVGDSQIALTMSNGKCIQAGEMFIFY